MPEVKYSYSDIVLEPKYSEVRSRSNVNVSAKLGDRVFKIGVLPANMVCTIGKVQAKWLSENDYFYSFHRFDSKNNKKDLYWFVENANKENWKTISISIGVQIEDRKFIEEIISNKLRVDFITIDIAHGNSILMKEMLTFIIDKYSWHRKTLKRPYLIGGNVANGDGVRNLALWGCNGVKCGISFGKSCQTYNQTGFAVPMFSCIEECSNALYEPTYGGVPQKIYNVDIISDGGIREIGDVAKSFVAGANFVMIGSMFAACQDSPAENVFEMITVQPFGQREPTYIQSSDKIIAKRFYGSSSIHNGNDKHIEGGLVELPCNNKTYEQFLQEIKEGLQSACSYAGTNDLSGLRNVNWNIIHR